MDGTMTVAIQNTYPHLSLKSKTTKYYTMLYSGSVEYIYIYVTVYAINPEKNSKIQLNFNFHHSSLTFSHILNVTPFENFFRAT